MSKVVTALNTYSGVKEPRLINLVEKLTGLLIQVEVRAFMYDLDFKCLETFCVLLAHLVYYVQKLSKSGNTLDFSSLSNFIDEVERTVHPQNQKYVY